MQGQVLVFGIIFCSSVLYSALLSVNLLYIYVCVFVAVSVSILACIVALLAEAP